ncbi:MAG: hypothetical protein KIT33_15590 [Candidatus Kapabacteria bacterium]|nr:hypothetical protein [Ignavibacteriota bacterium]MCW5886393.1 hypothetical protein [Candidatus Kapabacteria bacterium]
MILKVKVKVTKGMIKHKGRKYQIGDTLILSISDFDALRGSVDKLEIIRSEVDLTELAIKHAKSNKGPTLAEVMAATEEELKQDIIKTNNKNRRIKNV